MDPFHARIASLSTAPIPSDGLAEVLSQWVGRGELFESLAIPPADGLSHWSAADVQARACRILLERVKPLIARLPNRVDQWLDALPAVRQHQASTTPTPTAGTSWPATRIRFGWPPTAFLGRQAVRHADSLLSTALKWTFERIAQVRESAVKAYPDADEPVRPQISAGLRALGRAPLAMAPGIRPGRHDLMAISRAGSPWGTVSAIAAELGLLDSAPQTLAGELLMPDPEIRWRLFHLAILGEVLQAARNQGLRVSSRGPLRPAGSKPSFHLSGADDRSWDLWFEASGIWRSLSMRAPYAEAVSGIALRERTLGADLLLAHPEAKSFLILECKYSSNPDFVARNGYYQAVTYATELASRTGGNITAVGIGPEGIVERSGYTDLQVGRVGICPPSGIPDLLRTFLAHG